ncbi:MAG: hypothetical protein AB1762_12895 [Gemmatimonadota bacterium]
MAYIVKTESLASIRQNVELLGTGTLITNWSVLEFPPATIAFIKEGQNGDRIPVSDGLKAEDRCVRNGLYLDVPVVGAGTITVIIVTDDAGGISTAT